MILSRNDARQLYSQQITLHIPTDSALWRFIQSEQCPETETPEDALLRLLRERMELNKQGY